MKLPLYPYEGKIINANGETISTFKLTPNTIPDEVRAGGRIPLIIGRGLSDKTRFDLDLSVSDIFLRPKDVTNSDAGYTLAQKLWVRLVVLKAYAPNTYCEPRMTTVGSQDTTGADDA
ncbi:Aconitate hydratase 2 (EC [uncultured Gammaproteobacteria bacterium]|nr:Aconitate hydratase 2 (EC [uncultured Gammaproteobacteria bacterium]